MRNALWRCLYVQLGFYYAYDNSAFLLQLLLQQKLFTLKETSLIIDIQVNNKYFLCFLSKSRFLNYVNTTCVKLLPQELSRYGETYLYYNRGLSSLPIYYFSFVPYTLLCAKWYLMFQCQITHLSKCCGKLMT